MFCYNCKKKLDLHGKKVGFHQTCEFCDADLHVCENCKHYLIGKPNDCNVPNIDRVLDKEKYNFCEEFSFKKDLKEEKTSSKEDIAKQIFKDGDDPTTDKSFDSLFKD